MTPVLPIPETFTYTQTFKCSSSFMLECHDHAAPTILQIVFMNVKKRIKMHKNIEITVYKIIKLRQRAHPHPIGKIAILLTQLFQNMARSFFDVIKMAILVFGWQKASAVSTGRYVVMSWSKEYSLLHGNVIDLYYYLDGRLQRRAGRGIVPTMGTVAPPWSGQKFRGRRRVPC